MNSLEVLRYYSREDIQNAMLKFAKDKEVVGSLENGSYLGRPDILIYPKDILERVNKGAVAFHCSVENWFNPDAAVDGPCTEGYGEPQEEF